MDFDLNKEIDAIDNDSLKPKNDNEKMLFEYWFKLGALGSFEKARKEVELLKSLLFLAHPSVSHYEMNELTRAQIYEYIKRQGEQ